MVEDPIPRVGEADPELTELAAHLRRDRELRRRVSRPGYERLKPDMKRSLTRLYKQLDRRRACYRFTIGYRSSSTQKDLFDRWHHLADRQGASDRRTAEQVCAALHNAGFAQCPSGGSNFRAGHVAKGGPAKPGTSRHELGDAADIAVRFPPTGLKDLAKYQAAAHKPILCHFPPGPAP